jgi:hypothetical protein
MLRSEPLCLSTQSVISLSLKLKRGLNALLPASVGLRAPVLEHSIRDFFEPQNVVEAYWFLAFFTQFWEVFERQKFRHVEFLMLESESCA